MSANLKDIAIVGMGASGLYTAWRLSQLPAGTPVLGKPSEHIRLGLYDTQKEERM